MNFVTYVGDSLRILCSTKERSDSTRALDVSTSDIVFKAVTSRGSRVTIEKSVGSGITVTGGPSGSFQVDLLPEDTELFGPDGGALKFSIRITVDATHIHTVAVGTITIRPSL